MIKELIAMIVLGILSAILSYYNKNYYVRIFNDILGREEDERTAARVGRGFWYGFFFPWYFLLLVTGLICLIAFLIVAGIIAAIVFVVVWITEKILPDESIGGLLVNLFGKIGLKGAPAPPEPSPETTAVPTGDEPPSPATDEAASSGSPGDQPQGTPGDEAPKP